MRKLMSLLTSFTLVATSTSNLVACNTDKFDQFQNAINAGQSFIYYIGASDCTECTKLDQAYWNGNSGNPEQLKNGGGILNPTRLKSNNAMHKCSSEHRPELNPTSSIYKALS